jgi:hypothetical protein
MGRPQLLARLPSSVLAPTSLVPLALAVPPPVLPGRRRCSLKAKGGVTDACQVKQQQ